MLNFRWKDRLEGLIDLHREKYHILNLRSLKQKIVCLTLDVEQDFGDLLDEPEYEGLHHIVKLVSLFTQKNIPLTCFVQGSLFETHPTSVEQLSALDAEFELHSYSHPSPRASNTKFEIERGKQAYIDFFNREPIGYRAPLGSINGEGYETLASNGFKFDSSVFPSVRPGVFNNLNKPIVPYVFNNSGMVEFPITVFSKVIRTPISLSYIRLLGKPYFHLLRRSTLPNLIIFSFHLHDIYSLSSSSSIPLAGLPLLYKAIFRKLYTGRNVNGMSLLENLIALFSAKGYRFLKLIDIYNIACDTAYIGRTGDL